MYVLVSAFFKKGVDCLAVNFEVRCNFSERSQDKISPVHARMRQSQNGCGDLLRIKRQNVDVYIPRAKGSVLVFADSVFDFLANGKQFEGVELGFEHQNAVQKLWLVGKILGIGFVDA
jgi:hypothetical protein